MPDRNLAFVFKGAPDARFMAPVIRHLSPQEADIVILFPGPDDYERLCQYGLRAYPMKQTFASLGNYANVAVDYECYAKVRERLDAKIKGKVIFFPHSSAAGAAYLERGSLALVQYRNLCFSAPGTRSRQEATGYKCELAYTGPWHAEEERGNGASYRQALADELGRELPRDRKIVLCLQDIITLPSHLHRALNRLADDFTVIFRPMFGVTKEDLPDLSSKVLVYTPSGQAPNIARFAADAILCSFNSGTFQSSLMLGLLAIPYYSRVLRPFKNNPARLRSEYMKKDGKYANPDTRKLFGIWPAMFDLLDAEAIREAIDGPDYKNWYGANLARINSAVFGDFAFPAAAKTAEYIRRFCREGTLGKDCAAVY